MRCSRSAPTPGWCRVGVVAIDGTKVAANAAPQATRELRGDCARDPGRGRRGRRRGRRAVRRRRAATSCRASWRPRRAGAAGCARPSAVWTTSAPKTPGRSRAHGPIGSTRPGVAWKKNTNVECHANADYEAYRARGRDEDGRRFGRPPDPYRPPKRRRARSISPISTRATSRPRAAGCRAITRRRCAPRSDRDRGRGHRRLTGLRAPRADGRDDRDRAGDGGHHQLAGRRAADAGYWHQVQMETLTGDGPWC